MTDFRLVGDDEKEILISKLSLVVRNDGRREKERKKRKRQGGKGF